MRKLTKETVWPLSGAALLFAGAATALWAAPETNAARDAALASNALAPQPTKTTAATPAASSTRSPVPAAPSAAPSATRRAAVARPAVAGSAASNVVWTTYKGNAQRTGASNIRIKLPLGLQWRYSSEADPGPIIGSPLVVNTSRGRSVLFNAGRNIFSLSSESGELLWAATSVSTLRAPLALVPSTSGGIVLTTASNGTVQAMRASDGTKLWSFKASGPISVAPILVTTAKGARIILAPNNGNLVALTTSGVLDASWSLRLGSGTAPAATPSLDKTGRRLMISGRDGYLYIIDIKGMRVLQAVNLAAESPMSAIDTGSLIVTGAGNTALGIRADNNSVAWRVPVADETLLSVSMSNDTAYFATNRGTVMAVRTKDGQQVWKSSVGRTTLSGAPLVLPDTVIVGGRDSILYAMDKTTGKVVWRYRVDTERTVIAPPPPVPLGSRSPTPFNPYAGNPYAGNSISGGTSTGITTATPTPTPTPTYELRTFGISSAPAIVNGQLFIAADNAAVYSFATNFFDGAPPSVFDTKIVVPTVQGGEFVVALDSNLPGVPLKGPVSVDIQLKDEGSGIDPSRIRATFNGAPIPNEDLKFNVSTGVLRAQVQKYQRGEANELAEGPQTLTIEAVDYSGNTMRTERTFNAGKAFQSPSVPRIAANASTSPTPPVSAPAPPSWRDRWDPNNGPPPWAGRRNRDRDNTNN